MSKVRTSAYRQTPTPEGLKAIEKGTLDYFDTEMYANFNTEVLEEYLEEKNKRDGFGTTKWKWNQMTTHNGNENKYYNSKKCQDGTAEEQD